MMEMIEGSQTLTADQVAQLAGMVQSRLAGFGDPAIRAPLADDYRAERQWMPWSYYDLEVDIDISETILTLRVVSPANGPGLGPETDLEGLAYYIRQHVALAWGDVSSLVKLRSIERAVRAKIKRDRLPLDQVSVRFAPGLINVPTGLAYRGMWTRIQMLDDLLLPYTEVIEASTPRGVCRELKIYGGNNARRLATLKRLEPHGAALEIDAAAAYAIAATGHDTGDVVQAMVRLRRPYNGHGKRVLLWGEQHGEHVSVVARDGCVRLVSDISPLNWKEDGSIVVARVLPDTITAALAGCQLRTLIEHPLLQPDAQIEEATSFGWHATKMWIKPDPRPSSPGVLRSDLLAMSKER